MCISKFQKPYPLYLGQNVIGVTIARDRCGSVVSHKPDMKISKEFDAKRPLDKTGIEIGHCPVPVMPAQRLTIR